MTADNKRAATEMTASSNIQLLVKKLSIHATLPSRGSAGAAGYDLSSAAGETAA